MIHVDPAALPATPPPFSEQVETTLRRLLENIEDSATGKIGKATDAVSIGDFIAKLSGAYEAICRAEAVAGRGLPIT